MTCSLYPFPACADCDLPTTCQSCGQVTTTEWESTMAAEQSTHPRPPTVYTPLDRSARPHCGDRSRAGSICNRRPGHAGRHAFTWRHIDGRVREVWA